MTSEDELQYVISLYRPFCVGFGPGSTRRPVPAALQKRSSMIRSMLHAGGMP